MIPPKIAAFLASAKAQEGNPYTYPRASNLYSGKGLLSSQYPEGRDCSGFVSVSLRAAGDKIDRRTMWSAQTYWDECNRTVTPEPGDFVIFGYGNTATHIEILMEDGRTLGANSGTPDTLTPDQAREQRACVKYRKTPRRDLLGYVVNPLRHAP